MGNFQLPKTTVFDANGDPISGAKLHFYATGTTTPAATYHDEDNLTPHANPVVADSAGRVAPIYLATTTTYKLVVADASDTTIYTIDPVQAYALSGSDISTRLRQVASNPLDHDGVGDGVAVDDTALAAAISNATGTIDLLGKTYKCNSTLTIPSGKRLINGTLDFSGCTATTGGLISILGSVAATVSLTANVAVGDTTVTVTSTSGFAAGDVITIKDSSVWYGSATNGEVARVKTVTSGTVLTLTSKTIGAYAFASSGAVSRLTTTKNVAIEDLRIIGGYSTEQYGITIVCAENISIRNVSMTSVSGASIVMAQADGVFVRDCVIKSTAAISPQFGVRATYLVRNLEVSGTTIEGCTHGIALGLSTATGQVRSVNISGCSIRGSTTDAVLLDIASQYVTVSGCDISCGSGASSDGIADYGVDNIISGNIIRHPTRYGIIVTPKRTLAPATAGGGTPAGKTDEATVSVLNNQIEFAGTVGILATTDSAAQAYGCLDIRGNSITGAGSYGISVSLADQNATNLTVDNNTISAASDIPIRVNVPAAITLRRFSVSGNSLSGHGTTIDGIQLLGGDSSSIAYGQISNNRVNVGQRGIKATNSSHLRIAGNVIVSPTTYGISYEQTVTSNVEVSISDNVITSSTDHGIFVDVTVGHALTGCYVDGNSVTSTSTSASKACIYLACFDLASLSYTQVANNRLRNGYYSVQATNVSKLSILGNTADISANSAILTTLCAGLLVANNRISTPGATGIAVGYASTSNGCKISGNYIIAAVVDGITATVSGALTQLAINGNTVEAAGSKGISIVATAALTCAHIANNTIRGCADTHISVSSSAVVATGVGIEGNHVQVAGDYSGIAVAAPSAGTVTGLHIGGNNVYSAATTKSCIDLSGGTVSNGMIAGNMLFGGKYGIDEAVTTVSAVAVAANYTAGGGTGTINGTYTYAGTSNTAADLPSLY